MSVLLETSAGDIVIDLFVKQCPTTAQNFIKLCKLKYYNNCLFYRIQKDFIAETGDPTNTGDGGTSIWGLISKDKNQRYFQDEISKTKKFNKRGLVAMSNIGPNLNGSSFFIQLADKEIEYLNNKHAIFGQVVEGFDALDKINNVYADKDGRPY